MSSSTKSKGFSNPLKEAAYLEDSRVYHGRMRISTGLAIIRSVQRFAARIKHVTTPFVIVHGTRDRMTDIMGSRMLISKSGAVDKQLIEVEGAAHVLFEENSEIVDAFMRQVLGWLNDRL